MTQNHRGIPGRPELTEDLPGDAEALAEYETMVAPSRLEVANALLAECANRRLLLPLALYNRIVAHLQSSGALGLEPGSMVPGREVGR